MAVTYQKLRGIIDHGREIANQLKRALKDAQEFLVTNSNMAVDWGGAEVPPAIGEGNIDADGNLSGYDFSRQDFSNLIGSIDQFRNLMTNQAVNQGDYLGNINKVATAETEGD